MEVGHWGRVFGGLVLALAPLCSALLPVHQDVNTLLCFLASMCFTMPSLP
jgi:hypothetical protein